MPNNSGAKIPNISATTFVPTATATTESFFDQLEQVRILIIFQEKYKNMLSAIRSASGRQSTK